MYTKGKSQRSIGRIGNAFVILALLLTSVLAAQPGIVRAEGEIVEWTSTNTEGSLDADFVAANVNGVPLSRNGVSYAIGSTYNSSGWETSGDINLGKYLEWGLTPASGYEIALTDFDIRYDRSGTGPSMLEIHVSTDNFATVNILVHTDDTVSDTGEEHASIDLSGVPTVEDGQTALFRLYAYNASGSTGTFDIENVAAWNGKGIRIRGDVTPAGDDYIDLALSKTAAPAADVTPGGLVTYTLTLANSGTIADTNVYVTDTLPGEVNFAYWIVQPAGADVSADQLTWNGTVESVAGITFTFAVTNLAGINAAVVNTAEFSGTTQTGSSNATYTTLIGIPYTQNFSTCPPAGWLIYSVASNRNWTCTNGYMEANGFGGDVASDDWLISPAFDFTQTALETLTFDTWTRYTDSGEPWPQLSVMYATNYSGNGDPTTATWTKLTDAVFSPADSQQWTSSGEIDVSGISGAQVYFAFRYVSSGTGSSTSSSWRMDNFALYERPPLSISKTATPAFLFQGELVTYTVVLNNEGATNQPGVSFTDTLPSEVGFAYWVEQPTGAVEDNGQITWASTVNGGEQITFTFAVTNTVDSGNVVNIAEFSNAEYSGTAEASFAVVDIVKIHEIQGDGLASPLLGELHTIEGVVVGDFQPSGDYIRGFFVQEEDADADDNPLTSEGIFVYYNTVDVNAGDLVRVSGTVQEYYDMTQLGSVSHVSIVSSGNPLPTMAEISPPFSETTYLERYEGMLVSVPETLYVTEIYYLGRGGQLLLSPDARLMNPTQVVDPGQPAIDLQAANNLNRIILDDGSLKQNPDPVIYPSPFLSATNTVRGGDTVADIVGVLSYSYSGWSGTDAYRIHPIEMPTITHANPRPTEPPDVGGTLRVASFNVLNYFDTFTGCTAGVGGATVDCRGADDATEFTRQRDKIIAAMLMLDADVIGLMEIENDGYADETSAIDDLVDGLNAIAGAGTYAYVNADAQTGITNVLGTDAIKVGLIYKPATVILTGTTAVLDSNAQTIFLDTLNRPSLAQSFEETATGEVVTVIVNHLKSKGSTCPDDPDTGDGQGNCNLTRTAAAEALVDWLDGDPTNVGSARALIIGDLNSYAKEDPIVALEDGGYTNLAAMMAGDAADEVYSYVFDGQWGTLDYAMASSGLLPYVTGAESWHSNADEPIVLDYNVEYKTPGQLVSLYNDDPYRASDHDPIVVGLDLALLSQLTLTKTVTPDANVFPGDKVTYTLILHNGGDLSVTSIALTDVLPWEVNFVAWVTQNGASVGDDVITWNGDLIGGETVTISFRAAVRTDSFFLAHPVVNVATYAIGDLIGGSASATFNVLERYKIFLPLTMRNY
ncbi:MAG: ExeM/NucH family extracellular endonuclease [Anaerolineae bacterium]